MQILCGTDIIEVSRIKESIEKLGNKFINTIYTEDEIKYCESKNISKYCHYAGRFAAKEAIYKALSNTLKDRFSISWKDVQIVNDSNGRPIVEILSKEKINIENINLSISHCKEYAVAMAIVTI